MHVLPLSWLCTRPRLFSWRVYNNDKEDDRRLYGNNDWTTDWLCRSIWSVPLNWGPLCAPCTAPLPLTSPTLWRTTRAYFTCGLSSRASSRCSFSMPMFAWEWRCYLLNSIQLTSTLPTIFVSARAHSIRSSAREDWQNSKRVDRNRCSDTVGTVPVE